MDCKRVGNDRNAGHSKTRVSFNKRKAKECESNETREQSSRT